MKDEGSMELVDRRQVLPHECIGKWKEKTQRGTWIGAPGVKCASDVAAPPAKLVLSGNVKHQHECLGVYTLVIVPSFHLPIHACGNTCLLSTKSV